MKSYNELHETAYNSLENAREAINDMLFYLDHDIEHAELDETEISVLKQQRKLLRSCNKKIETIGALFAENTITTESE